MEYNNDQTAAPIPPAPSPAEAEHKQRATTAMILGIIGVSIFFLPIVNIAGFVLSIIALVKAKENRRFAEQNGIKENGMNTAGYICGICGIIAGALGVLITILAILAVIGLVAVTVSAAGPEIGEAIQEAVPYIEGAMDSAAAGLSALL